MGSDSIVVKDQGMISIAWLVEHGGGHEPRSSLSKPNGLNMSTILCVILVMAGWK